MSSRFKQNDTKLDLEGDELNFNDKLRQSNSALDELLLQGENTLRGLREQHYELKGVKRKILDVGQIVCLNFLFIVLFQSRTYLGLANKTFL
jgi:hypothetical protein